MLTGKCKEDFEMWFVNKYESRGHAYFKDVEMGFISQIRVAWFDSFDLSMQFGVYIDFFDYMDIDVDVMRYNSTKKGDKFDWQINIVVNGDCVSNDHMYSKITRDNARAKAIEKANELYNKINS